MKEAVKQEGLYQEPQPHYRKDKIPKALREQVWVTYIGNKFKTKCTVFWCKNKITVFDYHVGHNIPESHGGTLSISNLRPICARCNLSMSDNYTIDSWNSMGKETRKWYHVLFPCIYPTSN